MDSLNPSSRFRRPTVPDQLSEKMKKALSPLAQYIYGHYSHCTFSKRKPGQLLETGAIDREPYWDGRLAIDNYQNMASRSSHYCTFAVEYSLE